MGNQPMAAEMGDSGVYYQILAGSTYVPTGLAPRQIRATDVVAGRLDHPLLPSCVCT